MIISIIAALDTNNAIGINDSLLWRLPADLRHFKSLTTGHYIIMGRKTYETIGRPLPGRTTVVISRTPNYKAAGCLVATDIDHALKLADGQDEVFICGGGQIYQQTMEIAHQMYITHVDTQKNADTYFPVIDRSVWTAVSEEEYKADGKNPYNYTFVKYVR